MGKKLSLALPLFTGIRGSASQMAAMKMEVSKLFPGADYIPFTPGELILDRLAEPVDVDWLRMLTGADFWGMYIVNQDGSMKEALYNTYHGSREVQQAYRDAIWADFSIVTDRLDHNEKLVLHMFGKDGWSVEVMCSGTVWTYEFKHSPNYRKVWHDACGDSMTLAGEGMRPREGYMGPVTISLARDTLESIKGTLDHHSWSPLPEQTLQIRRNDGSRVVMKADPGLQPEQKYVYHVMEYSAAAAADPGASHDLILPITEAQWDELIDFLEWNTRGIPVE